MEFNTSNRLWLLNFLPESGNLADYKILRDLKMKLSFSEEEVSALKLRNEENAVRWEAEGDIPKEIEIGDRAKEIITDSLKKVAKTGPVNAQNVQLFEMFGVEE